MNETTAKRLIIKLLREDEQFRQELKEVLNDDTR